MLQPKTLSQFQHILKDHKIVIVHVFAPWCDPCKWITPRYAHLDRIYGVKQYAEVQFVQINVDDRQTSHDLLTQPYLHSQIRALPTFIIFVHGREHESIRGANYGELKRRIEDVMRSVLGEQIFKAVAIETQKEDSIKLSSSYWSFSMPSYNNNNNNDDNNESPDSTPFPF